MVRVAFASLLNADYVFADLVVHPHAREHCRHCQGEVRLLEELAGVTHIFAGALERGDDSVRAAELLAQTLVEGLLGGNSFACELFEKALQAALRQHFGEGEHLLGIVLYVDLVLLKIGHELPGRQGSCGHFLQERMTVYVLHYALHGFPGPFAPLLGADRGRFLGAYCHIGTPVVALNRVFDGGVGVVRVEGEGLRILKVHVAAALDDIGLLLGGAPGRLLHELDGIRVLRLAAFEQRVVPGTYGEGKVVDESVRALLRHVDYDHLASRGEGIHRLEQSCPEVLHVARATVEKYGVVALLAVIGFLCSVDFHVETALPGYRGHTFSRLYAVGDAYAVAVCEEFFEEAAAAADGEYPAGVFEAEGDETEFRLQDVGIFQEPGIVFGCVLVKCLITHCVLINYV